MNGGKMALKNYILFFLYVRYSTFRRRFVFTAKGAWASARKCSRHHVRKLILQELNCISYL